MLVMIQVEVLQILQRVKQMLLCEALAWQELKKPRPKNTYAQQHT
jgi:hypothetical protein